MRWGRTGAGAVVVLAFLLAPSYAGGQGSVHLSGQVESNAGLDVLRIGGRAFETITHGNRYAPTLDGFVWDPRFLTFSLSGTYAEQGTTLPEGLLTVRQQEPYRLHLNFFPQAAHSFGIQASRSISDNLFTGAAGDTIAVTTSGTQELTWNYRGGGLAPETFFSLRRQLTENETPERTSEEARTTIALRARKSLEWSQPTVTYTAEILERDAVSAETLADAGGLSHELRYEDRIRIGDRAWLTPTAQYKVLENGQLADTNATLAGPLTAALDGSAGFRYSFQDQEEAVTHTVATNGILTTRFTSDVTLTSGLTASMVGGETSTWNTGGFAGLVAAPWPSLRTTGDYALQLTGGESPVSLSHRAHLGASSTIVPRHTLTADYFLNVFELGGTQPRFTSHSASLGVTSVLIPLTTLTGSVGADVQEGAGQQQASRASLGAVVTPVPFLSFRAQGEFDTRSASGGGRASEKETGLAAEAGMDASPLSWFSVGVTGRRGVRDVDREDKVGEFPSDALRGFATLNIATLSFRTEGFYENEPIADQLRQGFRGSASYRFRIWTVSVDFERAAVRTAGVDSERERVFFRLTRPLNFSWPAR